MDRANLQKEVDSLKSEVDRISKATNFNGIKLLDGSIGEATGVEVGTKAAFEGNEVDGAGAIIDGTITKGKLVEGRAAVAEKGSFYMPDKIQVSYDAATNAAGKITFDLTVGDGTGDTNKFTVTLTGDAAPGDPKEFTMDDVANVLNGGSVTGISITHDATSTGAIDDTTKLKDNFNFSFTGNKFVVEAKTAGEDWDITMDNVAGTGGADGDGKEDITAMTESLKNDLDGDTGAVAPAAIALGAVTEEGMKGENAKAASYTVASTQVQLNNEAELHGQTLKVGDKTYIMKDINTDLDAELQKMVDAGELEIVKFDKTLTSGTDGNMAGYTALTNAINANKGTTHIQALLDETTGKLTLSETEVYGNEILAKAEDDVNAAKAMITDMATAVGKPDITTGATKAQTSIKIGADLAEGSQVTIGENTYQFLNDPADAVDGKIGVQFTKDDTAANAKALLDAIKAKDPAMASATLDTDGATILLPNSVKEDGTEVTAAASASSKGLTLQVGETSDSYQKVSVVVKSTSTASLGIDDINIATQDGAEAAIDKIKAAINSVSSTRGDLGAIQNRLEHTINNLSVTTENMTAAESRIRDVDMAKEMMTYTKNNILVQASQAMLAQANQVPQGVLQLLQ